MCTLVECVHALLPVVECVKCGGGVYTYTGGVCTLVECVECVHWWSVWSVYTGGVCEVCTLVECVKCVHCGVCTLV